MSPSLAGHFWTIAPKLRHRLRPWRAPAATPWSTTVHGPGGRAVPLTGLWRAEPGATAALLVVHGLGGNAHRDYMARAALAAHAAGMSCLRLELRGADRGGADIHHGGLWEDLQAALASPELEAHDELYALGYSLGGHLALRLAAGRPHARLRAVAAICPPLDLARCADWFDEHCPRIYLRHVLGGLQEIARAVEREHPDQLDLPALLAARGIREWDGASVVPRFGYADAAEYYRMESVGSRLGELAVPALVVASRNDPMVPATVLEPSLAAGPYPRLTLRWLREGGHVGFPPRTSLGLHGPDGVEAQALEWLRRQAN